jgi:acyl-CoA hydrolase
MTDTDAPAVTHRAIRVKPADVGPDGLVGAGSLLEWAESTAYATATSWCNGSCVLASVGTFHLDRPITSGDLVELHAELVFTGRSSVHILITICTSDPDSGRAAQTAQCPMVFVALNNLGHPAPIPTWTPSTMLELQRHRQARVRSVMRNRIETAMAAQDYRCADNAGDTLRVRAGQTDVDHDGNVLDGRALRWIDEVAYLCGTAWAGTDAIASYLAGIRFAEPIVMGDAVDVTARIIRTGPRSMHCGIACTRIDDGEPRRLSYGLVVLVALDEHGEPRPIPQWLPGTAADRQLEQHARDLIDLRQYIEPFPAVAALAEYRRGA